MKKIKTLSKTTGTKMPEKLSKVIGTKYTLVVQNTSSASAELATPNENQIECNHPAGINGKCVVCGSSAPVDKGRQREECICGVILREAVNLSNGKNWTEQVRCANVPPCPLHDKQEVKEWDWEKEFDKLADSLWDKYGESYEVYNPDAFLNEIKSFINSVLTSAIMERDAEIVEMIKKMTTYEVKSGTIQMMINKDDIINSLSNSRKG